ncbi:MAG TPA: hypothetical protein VGX51_03770 [Solirubrobacteraceae bacterium]|nr:hypothetical protein [Solirubrobacteraceae bacterium]
MASSSCPQAATSLAFSKFGDIASYTLVQGGLFESSAPNWSLNNAYIVNESPEEESASYEGVGGHYDHYYDGGYYTGRGHSLAISSYGEAVSAPFCVNSEYPSFRFLAHTRGESYSGSLEVSLRWTDSHGTHETSDAVISGNRTWAITPVLQLASKLPAGTTPNVRLVFAPASGSWAIDDVYLDPYRR